jgi:ADP-heptose:LPS heptosyltransferase
MSKPIEHILVIRLSAMGDVAMTIPVLSAFNAQHPHVKITVLTRPFFSPFFRELKNTTIFPIDLNGKHKGILGLYKLSKELKSQHIDAVADLHNVLRSKILNCFLNNIKTVQIDKGRKDKKALTTGNIFQPLKSTHQRYVDVFNKLGFKINLSKTYFPKSRELSPDLKRLIGSNTQKLIGIAPFAAHKSKMYSIDKMEKVIDHLSKTSTVLLFGGGQKEIDILNTLEKKYENVFNLAGKLDLNQELDVISNLNLMVSMDSGNAHIASMLGIDVVTLWGVTHPYAGFYPFHQKPENALLADRNIYPKIPTSIYGNKFPKGYEDAINSIQHNDVIQKIENILKYHHNPQ